MIAEPTLRERLEDVEDLQALVVALMHRVDVLEEPMPTGHVWVVMYKHEPRAIFRTEAEAEEMVISLLEPGLHRAIGSGCWFKLPIS